MYATIRISTLFVATALFAGPLLAQNKIAELRARLARETSAVSKAKLMPQIGDAEFAEIDKNVSQQHLAEALAVLREYRDEVNSCDKALDALKVDAGKHPGGFKELQFSLRESLRRLDAVIVSMTTDEQVPFIEIRNELSELNRHLIQQLFPREQPATAEH